MLGFKITADRGGGTVFGHDITDKFLKLNNLSLLIRSHEVQMKGYSIAHKGKCITVFSAPNYCGTVGNSAAVVRFDQSDNMLPRIIEFF
jgi:serine/threonine-protein phosphatase 5